MTPYDYTLLNIALAVVVVVGLAVITVEFVKMYRAVRLLEEAVRQLLSTSPRYFADPGKPRAKNPLPYSFPSKKGFGMSVQNGKAVHDARPGIDEA